MCGIVAFRGLEPALPALLDGLAEDGVPGIRLGRDRAQSRGRTLAVHRTSGRIPALTALIPPGERSTTGVGHTRWATHGAPTAVNAHPHVDCSGSVAVVHNGTLDNVSELQAGLVAAGHVLTTEVDTEVIAHLVEQFLPHPPFLADGVAAPSADDVVRAVEQATSRLRGSWALGVDRPRARRGRPDPPPQPAARRRGRTVRHGVVGPAGVRRRDPHGAGARRRRRGRPRGGAGLVPPRAGPRHAPRRPSGRSRRAAGRHGRRGGLHRQGDRRPAGGRRPPRREPLGKARRRAPAPGARGPGADPAPPRRLRQLVVRRARHRRGARVGRAHPGVRRRGQRAPASRRGPGRPHRGVLAVRRDGGRPDGPRALDRPRARRHQQPAVDARAPVGLGARSRVRSRARGRRHEVVHQPGPRGRGAGRGAGGRARAAVVGGRRGARGPARGRRRGAWPRPTGSRRRPPNG